MATTFSNFSLTIRLAGRAVLGRIGLTGPKKEFDVSSSGSLTGADAYLGGKVVSAASSNVATLTLSTGVAAATTGSPVITDLDGKDAEGDNLGIGTSSLLKALVFKAKATNTGTVTVAGSSAGFVATGVLAAGDEIVKRIPEGAAVGSGTVSFTFSAASDEVEVHLVYDKAA